MDTVSRIFQTSPFVWNARVENQHSTSVDFHDITDSALYFCVVLGGRLNVFGEPGEFEELHPGDAYMSVEWSNANTRLALQPGATVIHVNIQNAPGTVHHIISALPASMTIKPEGPDREIIRSLHQMIADEIDQTIEGSYGVAGRLIDIMVIGALREVLRRPGLKKGYLTALADRYLAPAMEQMHANPSHRWGLVELAKIAGLSRTAFAIYFNDVVGMPPLQYLLEWRMTLAAERLKEGDVTVANVAYGLGYNSESAFYKAFKKIYGVTPKAHLKKIRN